MNELEIIQHRQMDGLSIFFNTLDYRTPHVHPEWELIWVLEQVLTVTCGTERFQVAPGQMILLNPNEPHEFHKAGESTTFLCLQISPDILPEMPPVHIDGKLLNSYLTEPEMAEIRRTLGEMMEAYLRQEDHFALQCVGGGCLLLYRLLRKLPSHLRTKEETDSIGKRNDRLLRLIRFVDENYMHKIRLGDFAQQEGCSMTHLSHFIRSAMNQSFQEYVDSVRFHRACQLIADGEMKMLDVCIESGFSDYRYFSRAFQRHFGMTPEEYRHSVERPRVENKVVHRSIHSMEQFYSAEDSLRLLQKYCK